MSGTISTLQAENVYLKNKIDTLQQEMKSTTMIISGLKDSIHQIKSEVISERRYKYLKSRISDLEDRFTVEENKKQEPERNSQILFPEYTYNPDSQQSDSKPISTPANSSVEVLSQHKDSIFTKKGLTQSEDKKCSTPVSESQYVSTPHNTIDDAVSTLKPTTITLRDSQVYSKMARSFQPKWDGKPLTWKKFWTDFQFYWSLQAESCGGDQKIQRLLFMECLPQDDAERVRYWIQQDNISFDELIFKFQNRADSLIPRYTWEARWKGCKPAGKSLHDIEIWYHKWTSLAKEVGDITPTALCQQFDHILLNTHERFIKDITEQEVQGNMMTLEERYQYVIQQLTVKEHVAMVREEHLKIYPTETRTARLDRSLKGSDDRCFRCGKRGHRKYECKVRGRSPYRRSHDSRFRSKDSRSSRFSSRSRSRSTSISRSRSRSGGSHRSQRSYGSGSQRSYGSKGSYRSRSNSTHSGSSHHRKYYPRSTSRNSSSTHRTPQRDDRYSKKNTFSTQSGESRKVRSMIEHRMKNGLCAWCGDKGHHANQCPKRTRKNTTSQPVRMPSPYPRYSKERSRSYKGKERRSTSSKNSDSDTKVKFGVNSIDASDVSSGDAERFLRSLTIEERTELGVLSDSSQDSQH